MIVLRPLFLSVCLCERMCLRVRVQVCLRMCVHLSVDTCVSECVSTSVSNGRSVEESVMLASTSESECVHQGPVSKYPDIGL